MKGWFVVELIVVFSIVGAACQEEPRRSSADNEPDPSPADFFGSAEHSFRLSPEPLFTVGLDDALPLDRVYAAFLLGDHVVIPNSGSNEILIFDGEGELLHRQGRQGAGPGEYMSLLDLSRYRDGLVAWDAQLLRLSILDAEGGYLSSTSVQLRAGTTVSRRLVGAVGSNVLFHSSEDGYPGEGAVGPLEVRQDEEFAIVRPSDGRIISEITLPGQEQWVQRLERSKGATQGGPPIIFGRDAVAAVVGERAYLGTTDSLALAIYDEDGNVSSILSRKQSPVPAKPEWEHFVRDSLREATEARRPRLKVQQSLKEFRLRLLEDLPARSTLPSFSAIKGGADGRLWIREYGNPLQDMAVWIGLSESGERERRIEIPKAFNVQDISDSKVIVLAKGEFDEDIIEVYSLEPWPTR